MWKKTKNSLYKSFTFKDFAEAFEFIKGVSKIAEELDHHPKWTNEYNKVEICLTTHSAGDTVTEKDESMADAIDKLLSNVSEERNNPEESRILTKAKLFTDGGSRGNPGPSALGYVILDKDDNIVDKQSKYLGLTTNNQAEYKGLVEGLKAAQELKIKELEVYMDSLLIVNQINGLYKIKNAELLPLYQKVKELCTHFEDIKFVHVPRESNKIADSLVNECLDANT